MYRIILISIGLLFFKISYAQPDIVHGIGFHSWLISGDPGIGIKYQPSLAILKPNDEISLSFAPGIACGFVDYGIGKSGYVFEIPLVVNLNFGKGATTDSEFPLGVFFGGGFLISNVEYYAERNVGGTIFHVKEGKYNSPIVNAGFRFESIESYGDVTIGAYVTPPLKKSDGQYTMLIGVWGFWNFDPSEF